MCESGKKCETFTSQSGAPSSGNQMPLMNEIGRNVSCATGIAWSALLTTLATATPSEARQAAPSSSVTIAAGSVRALISRRRPGPRPEQQQHRAEAGERRAGDPRAEVDAHRQRGPADALEQPLVARGRDPQDQRRVTGGDEAEDRDRGRVELREADLLPVRVDLARCRSAH